MRPTLRRSGLPQAEVFYAWFARVFVVSNGMKVPVNDAMKDGGFRRRPTRWIASGDRRKPVGSLSQTSWLMLICCYSPGFLPVTGSSSITFPLALGEVAEKVNMLSIDPAIVS